MMKQELFSLQSEDADGVELAQAPDTEVELVMQLKIPPQYQAAAAPAIEQALQRVVRLALARYAVDDKVTLDADKMAQLLVQSASPTIELVEERAGRLDTIRKITDGTVFITADMINDTQKSPRENKSAVAGDWKRRGRIFGVTGNDGKEYYPRYQFDMNYQPLPLIKEILTALGEKNDPWAIAAWFHFPNGWITARHADAALPLAPKDALADRRDAVLLAARNGTAYPCGVKRGADHTVGGNGGTICHRHHHP